MKRLILALAAGALVCGQSDLSAEPPEEGGKPKKSAFGPDGPMRDKMRERFLEGMSPEIRKRFEAAREKALQDPKIQELRKNADKANAEFFKAMRDKMTEIDPELAEIVKQKTGGKGGKMDREGRGHGPGPAPGMGNLSEEDRQKLMAARETAKKDPTVQAAEKKKQDAQNPADRQAAGEEYRKAMNDAIVKADPSLAPILEKLAPPKPPGPPSGPAGAEGSMMNPE